MPLPLPLYQQFRSRARNKHQPYIINLKRNIMNALRNNVRLIGNLGDDPKVRKLDSGKTVANFSIATNEIYRDSKGEKQSETTWHRLVAWGKQAEVVENYVKKGSEIAIDGKISNRSYEDKSGEKHYITEILVNSILLLGKAGN
jgi:single-strand DNA-binding protein